MPVTIVPVRYGDAGPWPVELALPERERAAAAAGEALERHPFLGADGHDFPRPPASARVRVEVVVGEEGHSRQYSCGRLGAEIRYDPYVQDPEREVELVLHLRCYMGEPVEPRPEGVPAADEIAKRPFNEGGLRRTLWHEYGHMLDALRPAFRYDVVVKKGLSAYERAIVNELWNAYIDRRLAKSAPETDRPFIGPLPTHTRPSLEMMLRGIWADGREWTYREIVHAALDIPPR